MLQRTYQSRQASDVPLHLQFIATLEIFEHKPPIPGHQGLRPERPG